MTTDAFPSKDFSKNCYTHDLRGLLKMAGLADEMTIARHALRANWAIIENWDEQSRYKIWTEAEARALVEAVANTTDGVLPWTKTHY